MNTSGLSRHPKRSFYLYDPVSGLQGPVLSGRTVVQDVLDENASHHFSVAQPAAHPPTPDDADPQGLPRLSEELHAEERERNQHQRPRWSTISD